MFLVGQWFLESGMPYSVKDVPDGSTDCVGQVCVFNAIVQCAISFILFLSFFLYLFIQSYLLIYYFNNILLF